MSEAMDPSAPFTDDPSAQGAADELRTAAGENPRNLKTAAAQKAGQLKDAVAAKAAVLRENAGETAANLKDVASEQWQDTRLKAREFHASMEDSVRANPTKAVLTAAAIGFVAGLIIRR